MSPPTAEEVEAGIALYSRPFLSIYDRFALGLTCRLVWKCPSKNMLDLYNKYVTANHLDIGVGTGYFMDNCVFPDANPTLVLMDLNSNSLQVASKRLARYNPVVRRHNVLEPFDTETATFDSIGIMNLLHCLPGNMDAKRVVLENAKSVMNPDAVLFGSTLLYKGVKRNPMATFILEWNNNRGIMTNKDDDVEVLRESLQLCFTRSSVEIVGCMALFYAYN